MCPSQQETFGTNIRLEDFKIIHRVKAFTVQWLLLTVEQREFSTDLGCVVQKPFSVEIMSKLILPIRVGVIQIILILCHSSL